MNNDKELLGLAAKAAGMMNYAYFGSNMYEEAVHGVPHCGGIGQAWNPITDDGDALRLAVDCRLLDDDDFIAEVRAIWLYPSPNPQSDVRRAIVGAAAEIGKAMKKCLD